MNERGVGHPRRLPRATPLHGGLAPLSVADVEEDAQLRMLSGDATLALSGWPALGGAPPPRPPGCPGWPCRARDDDAVTEFCAEPSCRPPFVATALGCAEVPTLAGRSG